MDTEATFNNTAEDPDKIYRAMHDLQLLTRKYIDSLLQSRESADSHARFLTTILDSVGDGLIVVNADRTILLANQAAIRIAGWEIAQLSETELRKRYKRFKSDGRTPLSEEEEPMHIALTEGRANEIIGFVSSPHLPPEGIWVRTMASPIRNDNGEIIGGVSILQDISNSVKLKHQRDALATLITHDLKNHLIAESGVLEILADELSDSLKPEVREMLSEQVSGNFKYLELASTLVELCRSELLNSPDAFNPVALPDLLNSVIELNKQHALNVGVNIVQNIESGLPELRGVLPALQQVFHNLVQNAIHVSDTGQTVTINAKRRQNVVEIEVADEGPGIPADKLDKLFDPTVVASRLRSGTTSTGVGLHLCRLLLDMHGGKLTCASEENKGTSFFVELPL